MKPIKFKGFIIKPTEVGYDVFNKSGMKMNFYLPNWVTKKLEDVKRAIKNYLVA